MTVDEEANNGNLAKKVMFRDADSSTTPAAQQAAEATAKSMQQTASPTVSLAAPRSLTNAAATSCCKPKIEGLLTITEAEPLYASTSSNPSYGQTASTGSEPTNTTPSNTNNTVVGSATQSGDRRLSKTPQETETETPTGSSARDSSAESLRTAMRENVRLHSLILGTDEAAARDQDDGRSSSSLSTVKAVGAAL
ncbi:hypothetical protein QBC36DRAFT_293869 [Triangularia setosa]|uniref:Uncharacterized protein n=1 Tax=Triangularia setosa TaxID=2587417 RepID=A0AAN6W021_9PEZI|nr:hypothetical protein QBC36DRAFT_293869 [Podospora setosa]